MTAVPIKSQDVDASAPRSVGDRGNAFLTRNVFATNHKAVGIQFLWFGLFFFAVGGLLAMLMRWELAWPHDPSHPIPILGQAMGWSQGVMPTDFYNVILTMHSTIMVFFVIIPLLVGAFGNYLTPLQIGARDSAFPFLAGLTLWVTLAAAAVLLAGLSLTGGGAATGWTAYAPLSAILANGAGPTSFPGDMLRIDAGGWPMGAILLVGATFFLLFAYIAVHSIQTPTRLNGRRTKPFAGSLANILARTIFAAACAILAVRVVQAVAIDGQSCWFVSILLAGAASVIGAVNFLTTVVLLRCRGMTMFRLPLFVWSIFITSMMTLLATPVLGADLVMSLLDHHRITSFFEPAGWSLSGQQQFSASGGYALLHPHLFWFFAHPAVYIMILPAMGMVSEILSVFSRRPVFGYRPMIYAMAAIAFLGFIVWGHHMYQSGMNPMLGTTFAVSTMFIAVPSGVETFNWLATLYRGNIRLTVPLLNAAAFVSLFVIGGLSGIFMASTAVDTHLHMTYFIVAHIHYVLFGGSTFGIFAGIYYWYPKMFGRQMNTALGYWHFALSFIFFNCTFFAMHILGLQGMVRRIADPTQYAAYAHLLPLNRFVTHSAFLLGISQILLVINFVGSRFWGAKAEANPWQANTIEWTDAGSPPARANFHNLPVVHRGPYEYSSALTKEDWLPQTRDLG